VLLFAVSVCQSVAHHPSHLIVATGLLLPLLHWSHVAQAVLVCCKGVVALVVPDLTSLLARPFVRVAIGDYIRCIANRQLP